MEKRYFVNIAEYTYCDALQEVFEAQKRDEVYEDDWRQQEESGLFALIKSKMGQLERLIINKGSSSFLKKKIVLVVDVVNYMLFLLQKIIDTVGKEVFVGEEKIGVRKEFVEDARINKEVMKLKSGSFVPTKKEQEENLQYMDLSVYTYCDALRRVLEIRDDRQEMYEDDWQQQKDWELLALIKSKVRRLERFVVYKGLSSSFGKKKIDLAVDATNYSLFLLQNLIDESKESEGKK